MIASPQKQRFTLCVITITLVLITLAVFLPVHRHEFLNWDDMSYVVENDYVRGGISWEGIVWSFARSHSGNWHPLTWISHMMDCQIYGLQPGGHHLTNVIFHSGNVLLLLLLLWQLTSSVWRSTIVAALFALHPLHVESVAWLSERKDVLSTFFGLLSLLSYANYVNQYKAKNKKAKVWYGAALLLFACGLMSKPMLVTWPFVMLLLDYWPLNRVTGDGWQATKHAWHGQIVEKLPFFSLSVISCVITIIAQKRDDAVATFAMIPLTARLGNAAAAYVQYLAKFLWPQELSPIYPLNRNLELWTVLIAMLLLIAATFLTWRSRTRFPFLLMGWLWFLGTLVPVIGIVQVGSQAYADRYTYLPLIGVMIGVVWLAFELVERWRLPKVIATGLGIGMLGVLTWCTAKQILIWKNTETLFSAVLAKHPDNFQSLYGLGGYLVDNGRVNEGVALLEKAISIQPTPESLGRLADAMDGQKRYSEAVKYYEAALQTQPDHSSVLNNFAWLKASCPDATFRDGKEAVRLATRACELTGYSKPLFIGTLAAAQAEAGDFQTAIGTAERAASLAGALKLDDTTKRNRELIELYRQGRPYHNGN